MVTPGPRHSPAAERNKQPILERLLALLPACGRALEIASGTGQHVAHFATHLPNWQWQPSDLDDTGFPTIAHAIDQAGLANVDAPVCLDVQGADWGLSPGAFDLVFCANMLHIAPWPCCAGLMQGAARHLSPTGRLVTYGPYFESDAPSAPSNQEFDASLRARNPQWGIRELDAVRAQAASAGLRLRERHAMPTNNLLLVWTIG